MQYEARWNGTGMMSDRQEAIFQMNTGGKLSSQKDGLPVAGFLYSHDYDRTA
jgi:hypothetical protein